MKRFRATDLLQRPPDRGFPDDYLRARLRGRRSGLISDWTALLSRTAHLAEALNERYRRIFRDISASGAGASVSLEYRWVYSQMNSAMREACGPFFLYSELRTIFICLRHLMELQPGRISGPLSVSLLSEGMKKLLLDAADVGAAVRRIGQMFETLGLEFRGIAGVFERSGLAAFERELTERYLSAALASDIHPVVKIVLRRIIDSRNIIAAYKWLNFRPDGAFSPAPGGDIPGERLMAIVEREDREDLASVVREFMHPVPGDNLFGNPEPALYRGMTSYLRRKGRDPSGIWPVLEYLWLISVEAMNLNLLVKAGGLPGESVAGGLVR